MFRRIETIWWFNIEKMMRDGDMARVRKYLTEKAGLI